MLITEKRIREIIRKNLIKESSPGQITASAPLAQAKIDEKFDITKFEVYKTGKYSKFLQDFRKVITDKKIHEFENDIIKFLLGNEANFTDSDTLIEKMQINLKKFDGTLSPWNAKNATDLVEKINDISDKDDTTVKEIFKLARPMSRTGGWGAGKGEILSLLLVDPSYRSGGSAEKDLYKSNNDFIEIKQIESSATKINIPLNAFPDKKIAKDFEQNLNDIKRTINTFEQLLEDEFIKTNDLQSSSWSNTFFGTADAIKKFKGDHDFINEIEENNNQDRITIFKVLSKFIFDSFDRDDIVIAALSKFIDDKIITNLKDINKIKKGEIFPIYGFNNSILEIKSYTNDIYASIESTYNLFKDNSGNINTNKPEVKNLFYDKNNQIKKKKERDFESIKEAFNEIQNLKNNIVDDWYTKLNDSFNEYFGQKLNVIKNPNLLNISLAQFSKGNFDTLFDDILFRSIEKIDSKISSTVAPSEKEDDNIVITLDDGKDEVELFTTINDFKIINPVNFDLKGSIKNIGSDVKSINMSNISFSNDEMRKKLQDKRYKRFFAINENKNKTKKFIFETSANIASEPFSHENFEKINNKNYSEINSYKEPSKMKNKPLIEKIDNLISNLICLERSFFNYYRPGIVIISERNGTVDKAAVLCDQNTNIVEVRINNGLGIIDIFDRSMMKIETKYIFETTPSNDSECILRKLITARNNIKEKIVAINNKMKNSSANTSQVTNQI